MNWSNCLFKGLKLYSTVQNSSDMSSEKMVERLGVSGILYVFFFVIDCSIY